MRIRCVAAVVGAMSTFAYAGVDINVDTPLNDMSKQQQAQVEVLVNSFDVEKFAAKLCYNYIVIMTRTADVATCAQAIRACDVDPGEMGGREPLGIAISKSALSGTRVVKCMETLAQYNRKLPAFNCLSEKSDSNMAIWKQLETSRFPQEVESCIEDLRSDQIGFH